MSSFIINSTNLALESPELALDGQWGMLHSYLTHSQPLEIEQDVKEDTSALDEAAEEQSNIIPGNKNIVMDTLSEFYQLYIESEEERDDPIQQEKVEDMERAISRTCKNVGNSLEAYYQRIATAYNDILKSRITKGYYSLKPSVNFYDISHPMRELAMKPWKVKELPGTSPSSQWPESLEDLNNRLEQCEPMTAWHEPLFNKDGKDFFEQAEDFIKNTVVKKKKLVESNASKNTLEKCDETLALAIAALVGMSVLSADYTKILSALYVIYEISEEYPESDNILQSVNKTMVKYINELKSIHSDTKSYHHLAQGSIYGSILLPKEATADYQADGVSSLATDGTYLYLYWCSGRGGMFKIGTGEGNSLAGKVYLHQRNEINGSITWVYLKNKLYARKVDEALGVLTVLSPDTFAVEGNISLHCNDKNILNNASSARFNKRYPLLTDGEYLYIVVMSIASRERKLKDKYVEEVKKIREEDAKKKSEDKAKQPQPPPDPNQANALLSKKGEALYNKSYGQPDQTPPVTNPDGTEPFSKTIDSLKEAKL
jgi:hypothetical protein